MRAAALLSGALLVWSCIILQCASLDEAERLENAARSMKRTYRRVNVAVRSKDAYAEDEDGHEHKQMHQYYQPSRLHEAEEYYNAPAEPQQYHLLQASSSSSLHMHVTKPSCQQSRSL